MRVKNLRLALIVVAPVVCLVAGVLLLRGGAAPSLADGPNLSAASAWPPIPTNLSRTADRYSKVAAVEANTSGILVVWSEGASSPNGEVWMSWNDKSGWRTNRVNTWGGYRAFSPAVALQGTTAHFVWVGTTGSAYAVFYRSCDLSQPMGSCPGEERVYPPSSDSSNELGNARIAVDSSGAPHVIWTAKYEVNPSGFPGDLRDRVFYSNKEGEFWSGEVRISGYRTGIDDIAGVSQDMPAMVANGDDIYVAWREKALGARQGIWVRHRTSAGDWVPFVVAGEQAMGYQISGEKLDEFPAMAASGDQLYVMWDRLLVDVVDCDLPGLICNNVYSMTYRVHTGGDIVASWWPTVTEEPREMVLGDDTPITALSWVTTAEGRLDKDFQVPIPDDYYSGARPQIGVTGAYTPYVVWHHWANEGHWSDEVDSVAPYQVSFSYVYEGDQMTARWEDPEPISVMGSRGIFASPSMVLAPGIESPHDLHVALNVRLKADPAPWDVLYTNLGQYYWVRLPLITRN